MTEIKPMLWQAFFGDIPMPEHCTYWQFVAAREALWRDTDLEASGRYVRTLRGLEEMPKMAPQREALEELITNELEGATHHEL